MNDTSRTKWNAEEPKEIMRLFKELLRQPICKFPTKGRTLRAPNTHGVYVIRNENNHVVHVGRTQRAKAGLHKRLCDHLSGNSSFKRDYLRGDGSQLRRGYSFQHLKVQDPRQRALLELLAAGSLCPLHLGVGEPRRLVGPVAPRSTRKVFP